MIQGCVQRRERWNGCLTVRLRNITCTEHLCVNPGYLCSGFSLCWDLWESLLSLWWQCQSGEVNWSLTGTSPPLAVVAMATGMSSHCTAPCSELLLPHRWQVLWKPESLPAAKSSAECNKHPASLQPANSLLLQRLAWCFLFSFGYFWMYLFILPVKKWRLVRVNIFGWFFFWLASRVKINRGYFLYLLFVVSECLTSVNKAKPDL